MRNRASAAPGLMIVLPALMALSATVVPAAETNPRSDAAGNPRQEQMEAPQKKPSAAALLQMEDGRKGRGNLIATTGVRGFNKPAAVNAHALIMTIGDYQGGVPKLSGVAHDAATATEIAKRLGVPAANIMTRRESELTRDGMIEALDTLEAKLDGNSQVFIYYSGHGGRQLVSDENGSERCAESLITYDAQGLADSELEARMKRIAAQSQKTIMFIDACHSGGVTTRSVGTKTAAYTPKSYSPPGKNCTKPTNILTRSIRLVREPGAGGANFVHIAAARDSEISLDQPGRGGVASQAWLACLSGAATDSDGSGGLSAEEIRSCAQNRINNQLQSATGYLPHHVSITGNAGMVLSYATSSGTGAAASANPSVATPPPSTKPPAAATSAPATSPAPVPVAMAPAPTSAPPGLPTRPDSPPTPVSAAPATTSVAPPLPTRPAPPPPVAVAPTTISAPPPTVAATPPAPQAAIASTPAAVAAASTALPPALPPAKPVSPPAKPSALAALNDIYSSRDDRRLVSVEAPQTQLKIGRDPLDFTIKSREGGYAYVLMVGSDGHAFDLLFPNQLDRMNMIPPGGSLRLPGSSWQIIAEGPPGQNTLLILVADAPRDFSAAGLRPTGPFSAVEAVAAKDIQLVTAGNPHAGHAECKEAVRTRNLNVQRRCSSSYAAALLKIEEVR